MCNDEQEERKHLHTNGRSKKVADRPDGHLFIALLYMRWIVPICVVLLLVHAGTYDIMKYFTLFMMQKE